MPSAQTMLSAHQACIASQKGAGQSGLAAQVQHGPAIRALLALVDADADPRKVFKHA